MLIKSAKFNNRGHCQHVFKFTFNGFYIISNNLSKINIHYKYWIFIFYTPDDAAIIYRKTKGEFKEK